MIEIKSTIKINGQEACLFKRSLTIYFILMLVHRFRNDCTNALVYESGCAGLKNSAQPAAPVSLNHTPGSASYAISTVIYKTMCCLSFPEKQDKYLKKQQCIEMEKLCKKIYKSS